MQITNCGRGVHKREVVGIERLRRLPSDWYGFTNLDLATGPGRSREIDLVLVAADRIFLIDLKDWHGRIDSDNGNWLHSGKDTGPSPVGKIHQNAKDVGYLLAEHVKRHMKGSFAPRVVGMVVITGNADLSGIAGTERGAVFTDEDFIAAVSKPGSRVATFGPVARSFVDTPLTEVVWKDQLGKFFNARTGRISPGRRRYGNFVAASDDSTFEHPGHIYAEYEAFDENAAQTLGTLRVWDFSKAETRFQNEEARNEIAGRERSVVEFLKDRGEACENAVLHPRAEDPDRGVSYWEVFDRRQRLKRLSEFVNAEASGLDRDRRIELARQLIARVAALHAADAAHLDLGGHSIWLESPSTVKLSHLMAAQYAQVESLGESRYQFLSSAKLPEDLLGGEIQPKRKDVFLLAAAVHWLLFGVQPKSSGDDMPFEWDPKVDADGNHSDLHHWLEQGLSLDPSDRFKDATVALDAFNGATASRPSAREVIEGLERFRRDIRSQKQFFAAYRETESLREGDRLDIWRSEHDGQAVLVKLWKRAAWGDQTREGPRILDFLTRARDLALSPPAGCGRILGAYWLSDAIAIVQTWVEGPDLSEALRGGFFEGSETSALNFALRLANGVDALHEQGLTHGDLKPQNIIIAAHDDGRPVLIDLVDFSATDDGDIRSNAYAPARGGRMERDRFAVTRIVEELFTAVALPMTVAADIATAIVTCRDSAPENGTLLPLIEALERGLVPRPEQGSPMVLNLAIQGALVGPLLPDEGALHIRRGFGRPSFLIRGACEEIEVFLDNAGRPSRARRAPLDQNRIGRLARFEFMSCAAEVAVVRSDVTELSDLSKLMDDPAFVASWAEQSAPKRGAPPADELSDPDPEPAFEDAALDRLGEGGNGGHGSDLVDVRQLWRALIDAEVELTTDGVAQADSAYNRDLRRHIVPFELTSGTFDFNRSDRVAVERLDRKGAWRRIGELDIVRSRPDRILIDATEQAVANQAGLVEGDQRLRFTSHFQVQSLKRRESAISRILAGDARITGLSAAFEPGTTARPNLLSVSATTEQLSRYGLNAAQSTAFQKLLTVRPVGALQGPPGTGKTHFISALAHYALTHGLARNILLASQSHEAVNNAAEAVLRLFAGQDEQPSILRVGNEGVVSERLMPFHTDRLEQLYKDRFRAEMRERLRSVGRALGLPPTVVEVIIGVETTLRPVAEKLVALRSESEPDMARINSLADTLATQAAHLVPLPAHVAVNDEYPLQVLEAVVSATVDQLPAGERPASERMGKLRTIVQVGRDFVGSVSTQQRGFEAFLAGTRQIVAGTCVGLGRTSLGLTATPFDLVIIDEAARCTASELAVPMQAGRWVVLVGDHAQLEPQHPATVVSKVAADIGADELDVIRSDFERLFANDYGAAAGARLKTQYRMLPAIGKVVSDTFYNSELEAGRTIPEVDPAILPAGLEAPITWITTDCLGELGGERAEETGTSRINPSEADAIVSLLKAWAGKKSFVSWATSQVKHAHVVGVICMYAAQRDLVRRRVQAANLPEAFRRTIKIDTVDSYQGKENPIVVLSLVRNNTHGSPERGLATIKAGFLNRPNRINVAVSRAMDRLVIVGAKTRWQVATPMARLADAVELQFQAGEAKIIPVSALQGGEAAATSEPPAPVPVEA